MWEKDENWVLNSGFLACLVNKKAKEKKTFKYEDKLILNILFLN